MNRLPGESLTGRETELVEDPRWHEFKREATNMIVVARKLSVAGQSWRDVKVATVAMAHDFTGGVHFLDGANNKPDPDSQVERDCGEMKVIRDAHGMPSRGPEDEYISDPDDAVSKVAIYAMVVSGPPQPDDKSGLESPTLHCCASCRGIIEHEIMYAGVINSNTIIMTVDPRRAVLELYTAAELLEKHRRAIKHENVQLNPYVGREDFEINTLVSRALDEFADTHPDIVFALPPEQGSIS